MQFDGELEARLTAWARWMLDLRDGNIGWPRESLLKVILEVGIITHSSKSRPPFTNDRELEINLWINRLAKSHPDNADALVDYYLNPRTSKVDLAQKRRISKRRFEERIAHAKLWLSGRLAANDKEFT